MSAQLVERELKNTDDQTLSLSTVKRYCGVHDTILCLDNAMHNFREYKNVHRYLTTSLNDSLSIKNMGYSKGVLLGLPERWLIVTEPIQHFPKTPIENIVLTNNAEVLLDSIQKYFSPKKIIINVSKMNAGFINDCKRLNLNYHDIKTQGAYLIDY